MPEHRQSLNQSIVLMGVSGSGKSTVGKLLSTKTGALFFDGDDFHPKENIRKMASGTPLNDEDRRGWLEALSELLNDHDQSIIIACSALKQSYRDILTSGNIKPRFVYLQGSRELLEERAHARSGQEDHFMPANLLDSQLDTLEQPSSEALTISIELAPEQITETILAS
ncbi:gluconokinase, GntK/IdnK-type [Akkermansiaceae bacterium]|nr:gluconokinase, GntK/IdnK-type [Akkermansiaceae bacterium]